MNKAIAIGLTVMAFVLGRSLREASWHGNTRATRQHPLREWCLHVHGGKIQRPLL
jgi:hypothetical protein